MNGVGDHAALSRMPKLRPTTTMVPASTNRKAGPSSGFGTRERVGCTSTSALRVPNFRV